MASSALSALSVRDVQNRVRSVDMTLFPGVKKMLGEKQTFVYSLLAGFCQFAGADVSNETEEVREYATKVREEAQVCLREIESHGYQLDNQDLKGNLQEQLNSLLFYPKKTDFEMIENPELIASLQAFIKAGTYTLYKLPTDPEKYYGGRIDIDAASFEEATRLLGRYREAADEVGSSFDHQGHVSTVEPGELGKRYEEVVKKHEDFVAAASSDAVIKPVGLKVGAPQTGRLSKVVTIVVDVENLNQYRASLGLGPMKFPPHLSVFSQEITPTPSLVGKSIVEFANEPGNPLLLRLHECFLKAHL